jgi:hypothetical protein
MVAVQSHVYLVLPCALVHTSASAGCSLHCCFTHPLLCPLLLHAPAAWPVTALRVPAAAYYSACRTRAPRPRTMSPPSMR